MTSGTDNHTFITQGFQILRQAMASYIARELRAAYGSTWWQTAVYDKLYDEQKRNLPSGGSDEAVANELDIAICLLLFDLYWTSVFRLHLPPDCRTWAKELKGVRDRWAHAGKNEFNEDDTWRYLDNMSRLCGYLDPEYAEELRSLQRKVRYGSADGSMSSTSAASQEKVTILTPSPAGLPSWRQIIQPHPDVAEGRYYNAEFAADLAQVASGGGSFEYRDPKEFFDRTYITEGLKGLLIQAIQRVAGQGGEPVIQLKTAFGGGKTHSMLALYHLLRGGSVLNKIGAVGALLKAAQISALPPVHVAVLVGTHLDPNVSKPAENLPNTTISTLWGDLAAQLALSANKPELYELVRKADENGVSPGSAALRKLFDSCGSCLVLMDELVAYARRIYGAKTRLPAGNFDNFISFIQEISEAARASKSSLVVASIPESDIEIVSDAGRKALHVIEHTFGRMEAIWKPVAANEGFEVVRRRLFLPCKDHGARDRVCQAFSDMYRENAADFPHETRELDYRERMKACYPIHPEVFDRLYEDWATLEKFQRTRGVLRLMAAVIHELWMEHDAGLLIMPGSLPMDVPAVRDELTRYLDDPWNSVVDSEVDGKRSQSYQLDQENPRYGNVMAARRVARTIMLGSAPSVKQQKVRGIEVSHIRLGVVQPGEHIAIFNDASASLHSRLVYLYSNDTAKRFWFDTRPTLRKTVDDRAQQLNRQEVLAEIERRLKKQGSHQSFGVHPCPVSSGDIPDEQKVRLVVLRPAESYTSGIEHCPALTAVHNMLDKRGDSPRKYKNMLVFLAPDQSALTSVEEETRHYLAWKSVENDSEQLQLDPGQIRETKNSCKRSSETVDLRLKDAWIWLLVPECEQGSSQKISWTATKVGGGGQDGIVDAAGKKLTADGAIITSWAPETLNMETGSLLWKENPHIQISQLWDWLCSYCYLPRLASCDVLRKTIQNALAPIKTEEASEKLSARKIFGYAQNVNNNDYVGLCLDKTDPVDMNGYLVKADMAQKKLDEQKSAGDSHNTGGSSGPSGSGGGKGDEKPTPQPNPKPQPQAKPERKHRHLFVSTRLDTTRINQDVRRFVEEIVNNLDGEKDMRMELKLELDASSKGGFDEEIVKAITENCHALKIHDFGFSESE